MIAGLDPCAISLSVRFLCRGPILRFRWTASVVASFSVVERDYLAVASLSQLTKPTTRKWRNWYILNRESVEEI